MVTSVETLERTERDVWKKVSFDEFFKGLFISVPAAESIFTSSRCTFLRSEKENVQEKYKVLICLGNEIHHTCKGSVFWDIPYPGRVSVFND